MLISAMLLIGMFLLHGWILFRLLDRILDELKEMNRRQDKRGEP